MDQDTQDIQQSNVPDYGAQIEEFGSLLSRQQAELLKSGDTIKSLKDDLGQTKSITERLRKVFVEDEAPDPYKQKHASFEALAAELDREALEDQKRGGKGLPLTTKIGKELSDFARSTLAQNQKLEQEIAEIKKRQEMQSNPAVQSMQRITTVADNMTDEALEVMYPGEESSQVRELMSENVRGMINKEIREMVTNKEFDNLKKLNNPKAVRSMVNHFMAQILPPKARQILDNERLQNQAPNPKDLMAAFREASQKLNEAETPAEVRHWDNIVTELRQDILAETVGRKGGSINSVLGGMVK